MDIVKGNHSIPFFVVSIFPERLILIELEDVLQEIFCAITWFAIEELIF